MHRCSVDSNCRGLGIGKKLVEALEKKAKENGYEHMYLETSTPQVGAWKMYEKCGFQFLRYKFLKILKNFKNLEKNLKS